MYRWQYKKFRQIVYGFIVSFCLFIILGAWLSPAQAQIDRATLTEILDGDEVFIDDSQAQLYSVAGSGQQISTGDSRAGLQFNNGAAGRLRPNTSLIIGQCIQIQQGGIVASGPTNVCAGSVRAATRGTTFVMELDEDGTFGCKVLEGSVAISNISDTNSAESSISITNSPKIELSSQPSTELILKQGKKVSISRDGRIGQLRNITVDEIQAILNGSFFSGYRQQLPGGENLQRALQELFPGISIPNLRLPSTSVPRSPRPLRSPRLSF
jgi:hypothetical protein